METPLFDKSCVRVAGINASRMCGVDTIAWAGWARNRLCGWARNRLFGWARNGMSANNRTKRGEWRPRTSGASTGGHGWGSRGYIVGKSKGSQRTTGAERVTGRGSRAGRSQIGGTCCVRRRWREREIGFGGKCRWSLLSYNGRWGSGVEIQVQGSFVRLAERRRATCWRRCDMFESKPIVLVIVVVPPLAHTGCSKPGDEKDGAFDELPFNILEANEKREAVPSDLWGTKGLALWRERRWQRRERANEFASDLRGSLPAIKGESERNELFKSEVLDED
jgi:hypothetical protein